MYFWGSSTRKIPPKQAKKTTAEKSQACQDGDNIGDTLDPATAKVIEVMMANITSVIADKLDRMMHSINNNISQHLNEIGVQFDEASGRILAVENTAAETEKQVASLTKSIRECLQDQENRGRRKNLRILEGSDAVKLMEQ